MKLLFKLSPLILLIIIIGIGLYIYNTYTTTINKLNSNNNDSQTLTIKSGESITDISNDLSKMNLIKSPFAFRLYIRLNNLTDKVQAGIYKINNNLNIIQVTNLLQQGTFYKLVLIPEGSRIEEVATLFNNTLSQNNTHKKFSENDFLNLTSNASNFSKNYGFLQQVPKHNSLEGFLYPGSYLIADDISTNKVITDLLSTFNDRVWKLIQPISTTNGLTFYQDLILASIIDRETSSTSVKLNISDIFLKRLQQGILLGSDTTVQYALGYSEDEKTWWRSKITTTNLSINSPYNTRLNMGLPPGPIDSPNYSSITAAINPNHNDYFYFLYGKDGQIHYAKTLQEHNANAQKYL